MAILLVYINLKFTICHDVVSCMRLYHYILLATLFALNISAMATVPAVHTFIHNNVHMNRYDVIILYKIYYAYG